MGGHIPNIAPSDCALDGLEGGSIVEQEIKRFMIERRASQGIRAVKEDQELRLAGYNGDHFAIWNGKCRYPEPWFDWSRGSVYTKNPDPPLIAKAIAIAKELSAHVEGDDGEQYLPDGKVERDGKVDDRPDMDWRTW